LKILHKSLLTYFLTLTRQKTASSQGNFFAIVSVGLVSPESPVGTWPRPVYGDVDFQWVIKPGVETWPKKGCVSTPWLKWYLITNKLQNTPWPRPAIERGFS